MDRVKVISRPDQRMHLLPLDEPSKNRLGEVGRRRREDGVRSGPAGAQRQESQVEESRPRPPTLGSVGS